MSPELTQQFENLSVRIDHMIERIRELPSDVQRQPVGKSFSPMQAVEHMALTDQIYVDYIKKTDLTKIKGKKGKSNFLFAALLKNLNKPPGSNLPSPPPFQPKQELSIEESAAKWKSLRAQILDYLKPLDDDAAAIKHTFFGTLSPYDVFLMLEKHQDYHDARLPN